MQTDRPYATSGNINKIYGDRIRQFARQLAEVAGADHVEEPEIQTTGRSVDTYPPVDFRFPVFESDHLDDEKTESVELNVKIKMHFRVGDK